MSEMQVSDRDIAPLRPREHRYPISIVPGALAAIDLLLILFVALQTCNYFVILNDDLRGQYIFAAAFVGFVTLLLFQRAGLYDLDAIMRPLRFSDAIIAGIATSFLFLLTIVFSLNVAGAYNLDWLMAFAVLSAATIIGARFLICAVLLRLARSGRIGRSLVVLGGGEQARRFLTRINDVKPYFTSVIAVYADETEGHVDELAGYRIVGGSDRLLSDVRAGLIDDIVIALPWNEDLKLVAIVEQLKEMPVNVHISSDLVGFRLRFRPVLGSLSNLSMFEVERKPIAGWSSLLKSVEDYVFAGAALLALSPLLLLVAIAIKIDDPDGPVFFMQKRLGFNNQVFEIYKFRSMYQNAGEEETVRQATKGDPRVTRVGRFIRATSIDELPQLLNVLNGSMSLVGPRPHALSHNEEYGRQIRGYFTRHKVKPGITGWAQVNGLRGETEALELMEARIRHDIYYAENWSLLFDLRILATTVFVILFQKSAY
ncbi:undecaprenyl-phosphate glucose phosphotransferase [Pikeienuella piscinae]|uniref:Undecaprenyl-phosphate glucose phosphotransferase n=1 Tax=Pikeienuella piscinae TaxID=2748098 RepID=A0A7L5BVI6_9RHOB|nr:undecaprenyl-phosphate glucose phosphotransferase [Pikeienuella piscinae]QIE55865.1 undecaprenyl-phosphate glucose phosphotransferase [Pikeienuella piscinae]